MKSRFLMICVVLCITVAEIYGQGDTISIEAVNVEAYHVSRQLRSIPGSLNVITSDNLNIYNNTSLDALNAVPGVTMQSGTYTTNRIVIRGMGSRTPYNTNRIRSYLNDIPLTTSDGLSSPEEIDVTGIGRLEIIKGPSSALYGSGLGGSLNLFTPSVNKNFVTAGMQYGSFNTIKPWLTAAFVKNDNTLRTGLSHLHSDGYRENSRYDRTSLLLTASHNRKQLRTDFLFLLLGVKSGIPSSIGKTLFEDHPRSAAANWKAIGGYKKYARVLGGVTLTGRLSGSVTNKFSLFARGIDSYEKRPFNNLDDQSFSGGIRNKLSIHRDVTDFVLGFEWIYEQYQWKLDTNDFKINENRENRSHYNVFGILYFQPSKSLNISVAAALNQVNYRLHDRFPENGNNSGKRRFPLIFSPRLGVNYLVSPNLAVYASAGHGFSMPSPEETLLPEGSVNPDIRHEEGWQAELGSRFNISDRFAAEAAFYLIELKNLLVTKRLTEDIFTGINAGKTRHNGFELLLQGEIFKALEFPGKLNAEISYTYTRNKFLSFENDGVVFNGNVLPGIPEQMFYFKLLWSPLKNLSLFSDLRYTGSQFLDDANSSQTEDYILTNIKVSVNIEISGGSLEFYSGINNAGNTHYASMLLVNAQGFGGNEPRYYYPGLPRQYYAGIVWNF